ncbi:MAG: PDZ domain-containing protein [Candidatus Eisenbacteria bacterium]
MNPRRLNLMLALLAAANLTACVNPFRSGYESRLERWPSGEVSRLLPVTEPPRLVTSTNMRDDAIRMMESGYLLLGRSKFSGPHVESKEALDLAKEVGAALVLVQEEYLETVTESVPVTEYVPAREETYTLLSDDGGYITGRAVTRRIEGEFKTTYVPETNDYYDHTATYWAKTKPPIFGVLVRELDPETKQALGTNQGVVIVAVINDSPAFTADMLRGDVITRVAGEKVMGPDHFFDLVIANAGNEVPVEVSRRGEPKVFSIPTRAQ